MIIIADSFNNNTSVSALNSALGGIELEGVQIICVEKNLPDATHQTLVYNILEEITNSALLYGRSLTRHVLFKRYIGEDMINPSRIQELLRYLLAGDPIILCKEEDLTKTDRTKDVFYKVELHKCTQKYLDILAQR